MMWERENLAFFARKSCCSLMNSSPPCPERCKKRRPGGAVSVLVRAVFQDVIHPAGEDAAQAVQGGGGDVPVVLQGVQGASAEGMLLDEGIGGDPLALHGLPKRIIDDHGIHLPVDTIIFPMGELECSRYIGCNMSSGPKLEKKERGKMRKRFLAVLGALVMVACLLPTTAMAAEGDGLVSISDLVAHTDGTYDNQKDTEHYATNAAHLSYTYYDEEDGKTAVLTNSTKTRVPLVKTVTITGINFKELDDAQGKNGELNALSALIRNGRRIDSTEQFIDSVEVNFVNCTFNQTSIHLQVYKLFNVYAKKYTFKNCTFNQEDSGQYAITLNASQTGEYPISETETKEYNRPYSYEITNCRGNVLAAQCCYPQQHLQLAEVR